MNVKGRSALVSGGASGLGLATAQRLASEGMRVIALDLDASVQRAADSWPHLEFVAADVCDSEAVGQAVDVANRDGNLSVVVNCAGIGDPGRVLSRSGPLALERFERVVKVNLIGTFNMIRLAGHAMSSNKRDGEERGVIVNTASVAAFDGQIGQASYAASKAAIAGMTLPIAREFAGAAIRVATIAPGLFETPLLGELPQEVRDGLGASVPFPARLGLPDEYADLVYAIVRNPMLNGEVIRLDGAIRMAPR
ncbi:3-hydroxyacyl-CoA dehydrogenase [Nocardia mangyaensis]|uniref:3-hydroxyacyl-CoA dehydrogenase n=1 Tax=Nocardia mangyaensis TaxID=2213200 RepID=A0A1J0VRR8_9NOCA|nr:SDR family NAD(P)-dependent oxidoreductase [Nocardia mangyaensis]APE34706.1 3-hydroxyacyl-CoA dehydrogenase [Nocardia mangyaensis]